MDIIRLTDIDDSVVTSSTVTETDYAEFSLGTTFAVDDYTMIATPLEVLTLDVAPTSDWVEGDQINGQTSSKTAYVVAKLTDLTYQIRERTGAWRV